MENFKSIKAELTGGELDKILKITYNEGLENERVLFYQWNDLHKQGWNQVFDFNYLFNQIKKDIEHKYASNNK
jgi:hypothetical protein